MHCLPVKRFLPPVHHFRYITCEAWRSSLELCQVAKWQQLKLMQHTWQKTGSFYGGQITFLDCTLDVGISAGFHKNCTHQLLEAQTNGFPKNFNSAFSWPRQQHLLKHLRKCRIAFEDRLGQFAEELVSEIGMLALFEVLPEVVQHFRLVHAIVLVICSDVVFLDSKENNAFSLRSAFISWLWNTGRIRKMLCPRKGTTYKK